VRQVWDCGIAAIYNRCRRNREMWHVFFPVVALAYFRLGSGVILLSSFVCLGIAIFTLFYLFNLAIPPTAGRLLPVYSRNLPVQVFYAGGA